MISRTSFSFPVSPRGGLSRQRDAERHLGRTRALVAEDRRQRGRNEHCEEEEAVAEGIHAAGRLPVGSAARSDVDRDTTADATRKATTEPQTTRPILTMGFMTWRLSGRASAWGAADSASCVKHLNARNGDPAQPIDDRRELREPTDFCPASRDREDTPVVRLKTARDAQVDEFHDLRTSTA